MIRGVTISNFKRFREETFDLADSVVLAGPNNAGKSTLLQAIATWKLALDRWVEQRAGSAAVKRSGVAILRSDLTPVPLREMNLLWEDRRVTGPQGMSGRPRLIEIVVKGETDRENWECGIELQYANPELVYARPRNAKELDLGAIRSFPSNGAKALDIVHVPPLSGIEQDEPRRDRGMQDVLVGQGRPGEILRNLLWEIAAKAKPEAATPEPEPWEALTEHVRGLFGITLVRPVYSPAQPYIACEYRDPGRAAHARPLDLSNAGSGTLQVLLLFAFLYARPASVILLDEPDAHQHIILQRQVYDLIRKVADAQRGQVIVATHSEVILDATAPERVLGFFGERPRPLASETERDRLREALRRVTTTDLLRGRQTGAILYVEGETDERILNEWARILNHPAQGFFKRAFVHRLGGRSLPEAKVHFFAMRAVFPDLKAVCLLDGDNRDEPDDETTKAGLVVLRWRRYEIENYLLQPAAISRFAGDENLPLLHAPMAGRVESEFHKQVPAGTDLFGDLAALTRVKASEEFLEPLLRAVGKDTPKRDLYLLAAGMKPEEIHPEVRDKLDRIAERLVQS